MKNWIFILGFVLCTCVACGPRKPKVDESRVRKRIENTLGLERSLQTVAYCDSMLQIVQPQVEQLMKNFRYEKQEKYEDHGRYVHKSLQTTNNSQRNHLLVYVLDNYDIVLKSFYIGSYPLHALHIALQVDSMEQVFAGNIHEFKVEQYHEILTLNDTEATAMLQLIDANSSLRECIRLIGPKNSYKYYLNNQDKQALIETYQLGVSMRDIRDLEKQLRQATLQVEKFQKRLEK